MSIKFTSVHYRMLSNCDVPSILICFNCPLTPQVQFALWLMRYIGTGLLFFIGLKAPGLPRRPYMLLINEDERDVEHSGQVLMHLQVPPI